MSSTKSNLIPESPSRIDKELLSMEDDRNLDDKIHIYLCNLIPDTGGAYEEREKIMLNGLPHSLKTYYLVRRLEWGIPWDGCNDFFMQNGDHLIPEGIEALFALGADDHAKLLKEILPFVRSEISKYEDAEKSDTIDLVFSDDYISPLDAYDKKWIDIKFDLFKARMKKIRENPDSFIYPR